MKTIRYVCLIATMMAAMSAPSVLGQSTAVAAPQMQRGVSVQMAVAPDAQPMPEADEQEAWIVTVAEDGKFYFGAASFSSDGLRQQMISHPRKRGQKIYIKADARAKFSSVQEALRAVRASEFTTAVLLTQASGASNRAYPQGFEVLLDASGEGSAAAVVSVNRSGVITLNNSLVSDSDLGGAIRGVSTRDASLFVKIDRDVPYLQAVKVVDACHAAGATVILKL